ncbi:hypothetical protein MKW94_023146 [Papaver nudicaule]|uniref:Tetraspanin-8 n=1 Tax=Papaver nudicaule TaxID=74823 RepID=A0AA41V8E3_PAPNU|nr:hypothetical protein [Papaver nudicaule]
MAFLLVGILNLVTFLLSIPILGGGIWLSNRPGTHCENFLEKPAIALGASLMIISLAGLIGACYRVPGLLWVYLLVMFVLIVLLFSFTVFAFVVTNKCAGEVTSGRGYRLGDYSQWLQNRVGAEKNWNRIKSCLQDVEVCKTPSPQQFFVKHLSSIQSGCCKPPQECGFVYKSSTVWEKNTTTTPTNPDCAAWSNAPGLCWDCESCKAAVVATLKRDSKKIAVVNMVFLIFLIIVYSVGCCAFRNNREDNAYPRWKVYP